MNPSKTPEKSMTLHILGLGSIGILSAQLVRNAHPHLPICYLSRCTSSPSNVYTLHHPNGGSIVMSDLINDIDGSTAIEVLLIATKAHHTRDALKPYSKRITRHTLMIFIQNGMGVVDSILDILASKRIVIGTTTNAVYRSHTNEAHWVYKGETFFAPDTSTTINPYESSIISTLGKLVPYSTLESRLYRKLALNACINPVTAIFNVSNAVVADASSPAHALSKQLANEIQQIYTLLRIDVDVSRLPEDVVQLAHDTGGNISSMLADIRAGRETEIDYINGYIVEMGHSAGIEVVVENETVVKKVRELTA